MIHHNAQTNPFAARIGLRTGHLLATAILATGVTVAGASSAQALADTSPQADLVVDLDARGSLLIPRAFYDLSITNTGPHSLNTATVVLQLDPRAGGASTPSSCVFDATTDAVTCTFVNLPVGATATFTVQAVFSLPPQRPANLNATATRTSSSPTDPNSGNDTDTASCYWNGGGGIGPPPIIPGQMFC
jgi:Domain of unknown function DUF11